MNTTSREPERNPAPRGSGARHRDPTPDEAEYAAVACFAPAGWFEGAALPAARAPASPSAPSEPETAKALLLGAPAAVAALTPHLRADTVALTPDAPEAGLRPTAANVAGWAGWLAEGGGRRFVYAGCGAGGLLAALRRLPRGLVLVSEAPGTLGLGYVYDGGGVLLARTDDDIAGADADADTIVLAPRAAAHPGAMALALGAVLTRHRRICHRALLRELEAELAAGVLLASGRPLDLDTTFTP